MLKIKKLFSISALAFLSISSVLGQTNTPNLPIDSLSGKITYTEVVYVDSLANKQELFSRAREWFAKAYKSSTKVIQMEDKESGKLVGKALMKVYFKERIGNRYLPGGYINYTISIYIKDGRYKYEITDFYHTGEYVNDEDKVPDGGASEKMINATKGFWGLSYKKTYLLFLYQMDDNIKDLIGTLKTAMITKALKKDDW